jgi:hypothetical protein
LLVSLEVYQNGILRVNIGDPSEVGTISRFRISDYGIGVEWSQLIAQDLNGGDYNMTTTADGIQLTQSQIAGQDSFQILIQFNPFRILESSNGINLVEINN